VVGPEVVMFRHFSRKKVTVWCGNSNSGWDGVAYFTASGVLGMPKSGICGQ